MVLILMHTKIHEIKLMKQNIDCINWDMTNKYMLM